MDFEQIKKDIVNTLSPLRFPNGEQLLRLFHIDGDENGITVHYFTNQAVMERNPEISTDEAISQALDAIPAINDMGIPVALNYQNALNYDWEHPWCQTTYDKFPLFVGMECEDTGQLYGAVFNDPHLRNSKTRIASQYVEPEDLPFGPDTPFALKAGEAWHHLVFVKPTSASTLHALLDTMPRSRAKQCGVMLYRNNEWFFGLSNPETPDTVSFDSVADRIPVPVSKAKRATRGEMPLASLSGAAMHLPVEALTPVIALSEIAPAPNYLRAENHPAVAALCVHWNETHPDGPQAGGFRLYRWDGETGMFVAGDPEEPNWKPEFMASYLDAMAVYHTPEKDQLVVVIFSQPRSIWAADGSKDAVILALNGILLYEVGQDAASYDEAYYGWRGLVSLSETGLFE